MDLKPFKYVVTLAEEGNFSKAAKRLFMAQSSLSQYIAKLEDELAVELFDRSGQPITLTPAGKTYIKTAYEILYLESQLNADLHQLQTEDHGLLKIGITRYWGGLLLPRILPDFQKRFPNMKIKILEGTTTEMQQAIDKKQVDMAFFTPLTADIKIDQHHYEKILREEIKVAVDPRLLKSNRRNNHSLSPQDLQHLPFVILHKGQRMRQLVDYLFEDFTEEPIIMMETQNITTAYKLASSGIGATIIPERITELTNAYSTVHHYSLGDKRAFWELYAIYNQSQLSYNYIRYLITLAKNAFQNN